MIGLVLGGLTGLRKTELGHSIRIPIEVLLGESPLLGTRHLLGNPVVRTPVQELRQRALLCLVIDGLSIEDLV